MRILFVTYKFFPQRGGSETYTLSLAKQLRNKGVEVGFATLGPGNIEYLFDGFKVWTLDFSSSDNGRLKQRLDSIVVDFSPNVIHFHFLISILDDFFFRKYKSMNIKFVFTMHHPQVLCPKGDFIRFDNSCNEIITENKCFPCVGAHLGGPKTLLNFINQIPNKIVEFTKILLPKSKLKTCLNLKSSLATTIMITKNILNSFDNIMVLANWAKAKLISHGIPESKIIVSKLGTHHKFERIDLALKNSFVKGIYVGRLDKSKGVNTVYQSFLQGQFGNIFLDVYGPSEGFDDNLQKLVLNQGVPSFQVTYKGQLPDTDVVKVLSSYDFAVVPSMTFETGPFTVIEAFQAGIPVLGSDVPGINELVIPGFNGYLVSIGSITEWISLLKKINTDPSLVRSLKQNVSWQRSMSDVADDAVNVYQTC